MSTPSRSYFIVVDRNRDHRKELLFNVNFFYLKSFKKKKFTFTYINKPFFKGNVVFGLDFKNKMRPLNFNKVEIDGSTKPIDPHLFRKFIKSEKNKFIALTGIKSFY